MSAEEAQVQQMQQQPAVDQAAAAQQMQPQMQMNPQMQMQQMQMQQAQQMQMQQQQQAQQQQGQQQFPNAEPEVVRNLIINYIPTTIDEMQMRQLFEMYGPIESVKIVSDRETRQSKGYGFVKYRFSASAMYAIQYLNGYPLMNKRLKVAYAKQAEAQQMLQQGGMQQQPGMPQMQQQMQQPQMQMQMQPQQQMMAPGMQMPPKQ